MLDTAALIALKLEMEGRNIPIEQAAHEAYPGQVLWREGEEIEVRGCWFRVSAVRRTRITLVPIARPR
jgi:hypothetical protein